MKIAFIGGGNMATAIIDGVVAQDAQSAGDILIAVNSEASLKRWQDKGMPHVQIGASERFAEASVWVLAVKPQVMADVLADYRQYFTKDKLIISVAAGLTVETLSNYLGFTDQTEDLKIIRTMPNTPSMIGEGVVGAYCSAQVSAEERQQFETLFKACGRIDFFDDESMLDAVTALSGSGSAYVYLFAEALIEGALALGYDESMARAQAVQTLKGAALMMEQSPEAIAKLRERVTSPGGTTEKALGVFAEHELNSIVSAAMRAAYERSREIAAAATKTA